MMEQTGGSLWKELGCCYKRCLKCKTSNVVMSELTSTGVSDFPAFVRLKDKYNQELVEDGRLNKAADLAARREVLLTSHQPVA